MCSGETQKRFLNRICLARIALWLHPPLKILVCLSLSRVVLLHRIKIPYNLILLQRITFAVNSSKNILLYEGWGRGDSSFWGVFWLGFGLRVKFGVMLWFWLTEWVWIWVGVSSEGSPALPSENTSTVSLKDQATPEATSPREPDSSTPVKDNQISKVTTKIKKQKTNTATKKRLRTLRNFSLPPIYRRWYYTDVFAIALNKVNVTIMNSTKIAGECLIIAADLIDSRSNTDYLSKLNSYTENFSL